MPQLILLLILTLLLTKAFAFDGKSLPGPKPLPVSKALPISKALPATKPLPIKKSVRKTKKLPTLKALPTPKILVLKPVFEPESINRQSPEDFDPRFDPPPLQSTGEQKQLILQEGVLNLTLNGVSYSDIRILTNETFETLFVMKSSLLSQLDGYLMPEIYQQINSHLLDRRWVDRKQLTSMGFDVNLDTNDLVVDIGVPANYRRIQTKQLGGTVVQTRTIDIHPSARSASITPYWSRTWRDKISLTNYVNLDSAISFDGWVVENDSAYDLIHSKHRRKTTRIVRDFPEQVTRVSAGDIEYKTIGLMGRKPLGGASISREFSLKPHLLTSPVNHQRIFLENDATIRVFVNDIPRQSFSLTAGYYDLQDFPFIDGLNFVKIEITDIYGQVTTHEYMGFDNKKVLVPGITDYSMTAGFERITDDVLSTKYDFGEPAFSGYIRHGVHKNYTLGVLGEGDNRFLSLGGYGVATGLYGTLETSGLLSMDFEGANQGGLGANVNYFFATSQFTFSNTAYVKSPNFSYLGKNEYSQQQKYFYSGTLGLPVPFLARWRQSYSARYEKRWNSTQEARASFKLSGRVSKNYTLSADAFYAIINNTSNTDKGVSITLRWFPEKRISVAATYDSQIKGQQLDLARGPEGEQGVGMNASFANNENTARLNGGITWKTQYFDTRYNGSVSQNKVVGESLIQDQRRYETFSLTSSFAMVDGAYAMGPPIKNGSFVIFKSGEGLGRGRIAIGKSVDETDRESMPFLDGKGTTALFTNLNQYASSTAYMLPYLEDGFIGLDKRKYRIFSGYRSGALVSVSKEIKMYGSGVLTNKEWQPIGSIKGTFLHEDTRQKTRFFTDEEGYFEVENLLPGKYRIVLDDRRGSGDVVVKGTADNFIDFGILNLKGAY